MKTLKLNDHGDLEFDNRHSLKLVQDKEEIKQRLKIKLNTNAGEWFLNLKLGVPWVEMLSEGESPEKFKTEISKIFMADPAVEDIIDIDIDFERNKRKLKIDYIVKIDDELVNESVVI